MWKFIILPKATPLDLGFRLAYFRASCGLGYQLIAGCWISCIAMVLPTLESSLKTLLSFKNQLFIINFDILGLSMARCIDQSLVRTPGWMAQRLAMRWAQSVCIGPITGWKIGFIG